MRQNKSFLRGNGPPGWQWQRCILQSLEASLQGFLHCIILLAVINVNVHTICTFITTTAKMSLSNPMWIQADSREQLLAAVEVQSQWMFQLCKDKLDSSDCEGGVSLQFSNWSTTQLEKPTADIGWFHHHTMVVSPQLTVNGWSLLGVMLLWSCFAPIISRWTMTVWKGGVLAGIPICPRRSWPQRRLTNKPTNPLPTKRPITVRPDSANPAWEEAALVAIKNKCYWFPSHWATTMYSYVQDS